jgi:thioredoxin
MKKLFFICTIISCFTSNATGQSPEKWQNRSFDDDAIYGAGVDKAHNLSKEMKPAKKVTVALIGYGIDVKHKSLTNSIWVNPKEKPNGKDDDNDGRIDDIHGWNFLGNASATVNKLSCEGDREFLRLKDKYAHYLLVDDDKVFRYDSITGALVETSFPEDRKEFEYFRKVIAESETGRIYMGITLAKAVVAFIHKLNATLRQKFPDKQLTKQDFQSVAHDSDASAIEQNLNGLVELMFMSAGSDRWEKMMEYADTKYVAHQQLQYEQALKDRFPNERQIIGDNPCDLNDIRYGNNNLQADNDGYGVMQASIITETAGNAGQVKIMTLRIDADDYGESYAKDMALAIRYAVDKGADIIKIGKTKTLYPSPGSQWVDEALQYAAEKGIFVVIPMMDYSYNQDNRTFYPNRRANGEILPNIITVAASDRFGNPYQYANFSRTELDIFAPGVDIDADYADNRQAVGSGSAFAAAMVTGAAAFIKSYYPEISPSSMRKLLMNSVTNREDAEVDKQRYLSKDGQRERIVTDRLPFSDLCVSGGILNVEKAFIAAQNAARTGNINALPDFAKDTANSNRHKIPARTATPKPEKNPAESAITHLNRETFLSKVFNFKQYDEWKYEGDMPCVIDFWAIWCGPCRKLEPIIEEIAKEYEGRVKFYKVNVDAEKEIVRHFNIRSIPLLFYVPVKGEPVRALGFVSKEEMRKQIEALLK